MAAVKYKFSIGVLKAFYSIFCAIFYWYAFQETQFQKIEKNQPPKFHRSAPLTYHHLVRAHSKDKKGKLARLLKKLQDRVVMMPHVQNVCMHWKMGALKILMVLLTLPALTTWAGRSEVMHLILQLAMEF